MTETRGVNPHVRTNFKHGKTPAHEVRSAVRHHTQLHWHQSPSTHTLSHTHIDIDDGNRLERPRD